MNILYLLIPLAMVIVAAAMMAFRWATRDGQFDDMETPAIRILMDEPDRGSGSTSSTRRETDSDRCTE